MVSARPGHEQRGALVPLVAIIAVILTVWALQAAASVILPLVFALFLVGVFWPVQHQLQRWLPRSVAAVLTLAVFLGVCWAFAEGVGDCAEMVVDAWPRYQDRVGALVGQASSVAQGWGLPAFEIGDLGRKASEGNVSQVVHQVTRVLAALGSFVLVVGFFVLGLLEVRPFEHKFHEALEDRARRDWSALVTTVAKDFQRYVVVRTAIGLVNGLAAYLFCLVIGLELPFLWGFQTFLFNYIPTVGSIVATIVPVLFALLQFESFGMAAAVLGGLGGIQIVMGIWIDPLVQGKYLSLSPLVVLLSVTFWGWVWGIPGAFISVPLTIVVVIACRQSRATEWIARLLAGEHERGGPSGTFLPWLRRRRSADGPGAATPSS